MARLPEPARALKKILYTDDHGTPNASSLHQELFDRGVLWNICDKCGQSTSVEDPFPLAVGDETFTCDMNTWNPNMAFCCTEEQWNRCYSDFIQQRGVREYRVPTINGRPVNFWYIYNFVTQMGGWETVKQNGWLPLIYEEMRWTSTSIGNRIKMVYESCLLDFENAHFFGKRYRSLEERLKLFRGKDALPPEIMPKGAVASSVVPPAPRAAVSSSTAEDRTRKRRRRAGDDPGDADASGRLYTMTGERVWVKVPGCPWWPAQAVMEQELALIHPEVSSEFLSGPFDILVRFYGCHDWYACNTHDVQTILPWHWRVPVAHGIATLQAAIHEAEEGPQRLRLRDNMKGPPNPKGLRFSQIQPGSFEDHSPYNTIDEEEQWLLALQRKLEKKLEDLHQPHSTPPPLEPSTPPCFAPLVVSTSVTTGVASPIPTSPEPSATMDGPTDTGAPPSISRPISDHNSSRPIDVRPLL